MELIRNMQTERDNWAGSWSRAIMVWFTAAVMLV